MPEQQSRRWNPTFARVLAYVAMVLAAFLFVVMAYLLYLAFAGVQYGIIALLFGVGIGLAALAIMAACVSFLRIPSRGSFAAAMVSSAVVLIIAAWVALQIW